MTERWVWTCTTDSSSVILLKVCHKGGEGSQGLKLESSANCVGCILLQIGSVMM